MTPDIRGALEWLVNIGHGVGKAGGPPEPGEIETALEYGKDALRAASVPTPLVFPQGEEAPDDPARVQALTVSRSESLVQTQPLPSSLVSPQPPPEDQP